MPAEQRRRFAAEMDEKARVYGERYPIDEDFLAALAEMPEASGVALGLDRLVMLATGAPRIDLVQWTPVDTGEETAMNETSRSPSAATGRPRPPPVIPAKAGIHRRWRSLLVAASGVRVIDGPRLSPG